MNPKTLRFYPNLDAIIHHPSNPLHTVIFYPFDHVDTQVHTYHILFPLNDHVDTLLGNMLQSQYVPCQVYRMENNDDCMRHWITATFLWLHSTVDTLDYVHHRDIMLNSLIQIL
jgi:hypothetical protein